MMRRLHRLKSTGMLSGRAQDAASVQLFKLVSDKARTIELVGSAATQLAACTGASSAPTISGAASAAAPDVRLAARQYLRRVVAT